VLTRLFGDTAQTLSLRCDGTAIVEIRQQHKEVAYS